ncbi:MAG: ABC transporter substrate-binding protein, partial [Thermodesulfobacteriota bacterium]
MRGKGLFWVALVGMFVMSVASWANAQTPGVTDKEVIIGWTTPLSGPAAAWGVAAMGGKAWADYVNEQGGVHGRKIKVMIKDDGYNPARALA